MPACTAFGTKSRISVTFVGFASAPGAIAGGRGRGARAACADPKPQPEYQPYTAHLRNLPSQLLTLFLQLSAQVRVIWTLGSPTSPKPGGLLGRDARQPRRRHPPAQSAPPAQAPDLRGPAGAVLQRHHARLRLQADRRRPGRRSDVVRLALRAEHAQPLGGAARHQPRGLAAARLLRRLVAHSDQPARSARGRARRHQCQRLAYRPSQRAPGGLLTGRRRELRSVQAV